MPNLYIIAGCNGAGKTTGKFLIRIFGIKFPLMEMTTKQRQELGDKIMKGFQLAIKRLIEKTKKEGGVLVISRNGKIEKVPAKDL